MPNIIMADAKTGVPQWKNLTPASGERFRTTVNHAHIIPPDNCIIYLRLDSEIEYTSGIVLLGYVIVVLNGVINAANYYMYKTASEENPVIANETPFFNGTKNNGGYWTLNGDGELYRSSDDVRMQEGETIKYLITEVPSPDSFLPGVNV